MLGEIGSAILNYRYKYDIVIIIIIITVFLSGMSNYAPAIENYYSPKSFFFSVEIYFYITFSTCV